jgi:hypothetical protein
MASSFLAVNLVTPKGVVAHTDVCLNRLEEILASRID